MKRGEVVGHVREQAERAGVARDAHAAGREHVPELVVPEILREAARQPQPAPVLFVAVGLAERAQRLRERRDRRRVPLGEPRHEGVEEHVGRARGVHPVRRARGLGHLALIRAGAEAPGEHRRRDRLEVGLAGHRGVQGIEPPGRLEQQRRRIAPAPAGEHDLRAQPLQPRALELVERPELGGREQVVGGRGVGDVELRLRGVERALDASDGVRRQLGRPLQERGGRGQPATTLRTVGRVRHLGGHRLVRRRRRVRAMPGATVGIEDRVGRVGERPVHVAAVARVRRAVDRRADERMREAHACAELDQPGVLGRPRGVAADPETLGGAPQQAHIAQRLGRRGQEQKLRVARQRLDALEEAVLDAARQRARVGEPEPARELRRRQSARQLEQRERVAAGLVEDPSLHSLVERAGDRRVQQDASVVGGQSLDHELRQPLEHVLAVGVAHREHQPDPLRQEPARHERERLRRDPVEPLRVVDDAHERLLLGGVGQQAQDRQPDEEAIRRRSVAQAERRAQRVALRARQMPETAEHRCAQRMQAGERELHLGLDARRPGDPASRRGHRQVLQQGGLADARLAAKHQHPALARSHSGDEPIQLITLTPTTEQARRREIGDGHTRDALSRPAQPGSRASSEPRVNGQATIWA